MPCAKYTCRASRMMSVMQGREVANLLGVGLNVCGSAYPMMCVCVGSVSRWPPNPAGEDQMKHKPTFGCVW